MTRKQSEYARSFSAQLTWKAEHPLTQNTQTIKKQEEMLFVRGASTDKRGIPSDGQG